MEKEEINNMDKIKEEINSIKEEIINIEDKTKTDQKIAIKKDSEINLSINIKSRTESPSYNIKNKNKNELTARVKKYPYKIIKKSMSTISNNLIKKKFDPIKFNEYLKSVNDKENKKNKKIENMRKQEEEKELKKITNHPKINKGANIKYKTKINPKNYSAVERLYNQDLIKRKEKKQILTKIYTPTFKPNIYIKKIKINKTNQNKKNIKKNANKRKEINEEDDNYEDEREKRNQSAKNRLKKIIAHMEGENDLIFDYPKVQNKLRNLLFKNKRNKSAEPRKKIN